jgi:hypothetical protein
MMRSDKERIISVTERMEKVAIELQSINCEVAKLSINDGDAMQNTAWGRWFVRGMSKTGTLVLMANDASKFLRKAVDNHE